MKYIFKKKRNIALARTMDAFGYLGARLLGRPRRGPRKDYKSVLVIRMDHIGDVLQATAVPKAVKESLPGCRVYFLTSGWAAPLLEENPYVDEVFIYNPPWFAKRRVFAGKRALSFGNLVRVLRERKIEAAVGLRGDLRENLLMALAGIPERIGYGVTGGGFLLTREAAYRRRAHERERSEELLRELGLRHARLEPDLHFTKEEEAALDEKRAAWGLPKGVPCVGFQAEAGTPAKEWPSSHSVRFLDLFRERYPGLKIVLTGTRAGTLESLRQAGLKDGVSLIGKTTLREFCLLSRSFHFFIGPDSGPTHIASSMGAPTLFIYSGTNAFEEWRPLRSDAYTLVNPVPCSPCHRETCNVAGHPCMQGVEPAAVLHLLEEHLK